MVDAPATQGLQTFPSKYLLVAIQRLQLLLIRNDQDQPLPSRTEQVRGRRPRLLDGHVLEQMHRDHRVEPAPQAKFRIANVPYAEPDLIVPELFGNVPSAVDDLGPVVATHDLRPGPLLAEHERQEAQTGPHVQVAGTTEVVKDPSVNGSELDDM